MSRQVAVMGMGRFGREVARTLFQLRYQVLGIDRNDRVVQEMVPFLMEGIQADFTDESALRDLGVDQLDAVVVAVGSHIETSIMATVLLKEMGVRRVVARAQTDLHEKTLRKVGADIVVFPERETGRRVAHRLGAPIMEDYLELTSNMGISKLPAPHEFSGRTLQELGFMSRLREGAIVLALQRGGDIIVMPDRLERVTQGDLLIVAGQDEQLATFQRLEA